MCQRPPASRTLPVQVARSSKAPGGPGLTAVRQDLPATEVLGHGVADLGVAVAQVGMAQVAGGVQEEDVHVPAVRGEPEVPDPVPGQPQAQRFLRSPPRRSSYPLTDPAVRPRTK